MKWLLLVIFYVSNLSVYSQDLTYPELEVVPRASKRLEIEYVQENKNKWTEHMAIQISSLSTLVAGAMLSGNVNKDKDDREFSPIIGMGVGALWLGATFWASQSYKPYRRALINVRRIKGESKRDILTRERLAEEEIKQMARIGKRARWLSFITNTGASAYMLGSAKSGTDAQSVATLSAVLSFLPLFIPYTWENVKDEQESYKKKIYGPVTLAPILQEPFTLKSATGMNLVFNF